MTMWLLAGFAHFLIFSYQFGIIFTAKVRHSRTINVDQNFIRWPDKNQILYYLDLSYSPEEKDLIRQAALKVAADTQGCVTFLETNAYDSRFKTKITPYNSTGTLAEYCSAFPGYALAYAGLNEQPTIIARGDKGCLNGAIAPVMKYFTILLGRRNEHQRGDRDLYITVQSKNLLFADAYRLYSVNDAFWGIFSYDYCSITHNKPSDFAYPGTAAFVLKSDIQALPNFPQLSNIDCQLVSLSYGCYEELCAPYDCDAVRKLAAQGGGGNPTTPLLTTSKPTTLPPVTTSRPSTLPPVTTSRPSTTTLTPSVGSTSPTMTPAAGSGRPARQDTTAATTPSASTLCPQASFCSAVPDESGYLIGPYQSQTFLLFSGPCVLEYRMDWANKKLKQQTSPQPITTYFKAPGGPTVGVPVTLSYVVNTNAPSLQLNFMSQTAGKNLQCIADVNGSPTGSPTCATPASTTGIIASSVATSASSQLNIGDGLIYQYVVDSAQTNIKLMDGAFTKAFQTTTNFLAGQTKITKITAIQIIVDLDAVNPRTVAVFGTGADGKTPYVGFAMVTELDALGSLPMTAASWPSDSVPLNQGLTGC